MRSINHVLRTYNCCKICMLVELLGNRMDTVLRTCTEVHATKIAAFNLLESLS